MSAAALKHKIQNKATVSCQKIDLLCVFASTRINTLLWNLIKLIAGGESSTTYCNFLNNFELKQYRILIQAKLSNAANKMPGVNMETEKSEAGVKRDAWIWTKPQRSDGYPVQLKLLNTLTKNKDLFVPRRGNKVCVFFSGRPKLKAGVRMPHKYLNFDLSNE